MIENIAKSLVANSKKNAKRPGRGISAGQGKTAGRGTKGQKSRAGHNIPNRFEGGQTVLSMRLPKIRGFKSHSEKATIITLDDLTSNFKSGDKVTLSLLKSKGLIASENQRVKILNNGKLAVKITISDDIPVSANVADLFKEGKTVEKAEKSK